MEKINDMGLASELAQGRELARQLQINLMMNGHDSTTEDQAPELLVQRIVASYEKALSMLSHHRPVGDATLAPVGLVGVSESPLPESPPSEDSDQDGSSGSKKRKSAPRWSQQVRVSPGMGLEGPLDDGFSWRKYGQKDILAAKYPRGYYRCTNRNVQGCLATKQVQRSDQDPTIFEITYRGRHTCTQASPNQQLPLIDQALQSQPLDASSFHVAASPAPNPADNDNSNSHVYLSGASFFSTDFGLNGNYFGGSGSNQYFQGLSCDVIGTRHHEPIVPTATSGTNSPTVNSEFPFSGAQTSDPNFSFGNSGFFS